MNKRVECRYCGGFVQAEATAGTGAFLVPAECPHCHKLDAFSEKAVSDGSTASYYRLPAGAAELQDLISYRNMNAQLGEIFRAAYRYGQASHSGQLRDARKIKFYAEAEIARLEKYGERK